MNLELFKKFEEEFLIRDKTTKEVIYTAYSYINAISLLEALKFYEVKPLLAEILLNQESEGPRTRIIVSLKDMIKVCCEYFQVTPTQLQFKDRYLVHIRKVMHYMCKEFCMARNSDIAFFVGKVSPTSVSNNHRIVQSELKSKVTCKSQGQVKALKAKLNLK